MKPSQIEVQWEGSYFIQHSLAIVNREICRRLMTDDKYSLSLIPYETDPNFHTGEDFTLFQNRFATPEHPAHLNIKHRWPPDFNKHNAHKHVLFQPWEYGAIPRKWFLPMKYHIDEIWVYSNYNKSCYVRCGLPEHKIRVIPLGVDEKQFHPAVEALDLNTEKTFRFLFVGGTIARKGVDLLLEAYISQFSKQDDVCLVIKDFGTESFYKGTNLGDYIRNLQKNEDCPKILYIDRELSTVELAGLYRACDCLVHPYRGEGFGLPIIEAMACGIPAIVPNLGPSADFCDADSSFLIPSQEVVLETNHVGSLETVAAPWMIEVDTVSLQKEMRFAFENPEATAQKGKAASKKILSQFTWNHTVDIISEAIPQIMSAPCATCTTDQEIIEAEIQHAENQVTISIDDGVGTLKNLFFAYPHSISVRIAIGMLYFKLKQFQGALKHLSYASHALTDYHPQWQAEIWNIIGACYEHLEQFEEAMQAFEKGMQTKSRNVSLAVSFFRRMLRNHHDFNPLWKPSRLYYNLGCLYFLLGNDFKAEQMLLEALRHDPDSTAVQHRLLDVQVRIQTIKDSLSSTSKIPLAASKHTQARESKLLDAHFLLDWSSYFMPGESILYAGLIDNPYTERLKRHNLSVQLVTSPLPHSSHHTGRSPVLDIFYSSPLLQESHLYNGIIVDYSFIDMLSPQNLLELILYLSEHLAAGGKLILLSERESSLDIINSSDSANRPESLSLLVDSNLCVKEMSMLDKDNRYSYAVIQKNTYDMLWQSVVFNLSGYGEEQKSFLSIIRPFPLKIQLTPYDVDKFHNVKNLREQRFFVSIMSNKSTAPLIHYQAAPAHDFVSPCAPISIGRTMFETDSIPPGWADKMNELTEIWVPTQFNLETFAANGVGRDKIYILPPSIDCTLYNPSRITKPTRGENDPFKFLSIFDWSKRKGWDILLQAFLKEFQAAENVSLVLKVSKHLEQNTDHHEQIRKMIQTLNISSIPHIDIIDSSLSEEEMLRLYASVDAFVLPSRGEGYGRPYMEAMAMSLPTIGTRWSGQLDFMNDSNSYLIDIEGLVHIEKDVPYFNQFSDHRWAEPSEQHLRRLMRHVYENRQEAQQRAIQARQDIMTHFSRDKIAQQIYQRMDTLVKQHFN